VLALQAFAVEFIITFILLFVIVAVAMDPHAGRQEDIPPFLLPLFYNGFYLIVFLKRSQFSYVDVWRKKCERVS
jgi:glycerol uptake facilitator-like aquaporin